VHAAYFIDAETVGFSRLTSTDALHAMLAHSSYASCILAIKFVLFRIIALFIDLSSVAYGSQIV